MEWIQEILWQVDGLRPLVWHWIVPALAAYLGVSLVVRGIVALLRWRRGRCIRCSFDLRTSSDAGARCTDCGATQPARGRGSLPRFLHRASPLLKIALGAVLIVPLARAIRYPSEGYALAFLFLASATGLVGCWDLWRRRRSIGVVRGAALVVASLLLQAPLVILLWHAALALRAQAASEEWHEAGCNTWLRPSPFSNPVDAYTPPLAATWLPERWRWWLTGTTVTLMLDERTNLTALGEGPPELVVALDCTMPRAAIFSAGDVRTLRRFPRLRAVSVSIRADDADAVRALNELPAEVQVRGLALDRNGRVVGSVVDTGSGVVLSPVAGPEPDVVP